MTAPTWVRTPTGLTLHRPECYAALRGGADPIPVGADLARTMRLCRHCRPPDPDTRPVAPVIPLRRRGDE